LLFCYAALLLLISIIAAIRGTSVWFTSVKNAVFFAPQNSAPPQPKMVPVPVQMVDGTPQYFVAIPPQAAGDPGSPVFIPQQQYEQQYGQQAIMVASPVGGQAVVQPQYSGQTFVQPQISGQEYQPQYAGQEYQPQYQQPQPHYDQPQVYQPNATSSPAQV